MVEKDQLRIRVRELEAKVAELSVPRIENLNLSPDQGEKILKLEEEMNKWKERHHKQRELYEKLQNRYEALKLKNRES